MSISRDQILVDNVKASLDLYQRSLTWGITASLSAMLIAWRLRQGVGPSVSLLTTQVSASTAILIALGLNILFGFLAHYALQRYLTAWDSLSPTFAEDPKLLEAIMLNPSLATSPPGFRIGSALVPPLATIAVWIIEIPHLRQIMPDFDWFTYSFILLVLISPYLAIVWAVRRLPRVRGSQNDAAQ